MNIRRLLDERGYAVGCFGHYYMFGCMVAHTWDYIVKEMI